MNRQVPEEVISAYFDGEASPEERAYVEELLSDSESARRELNETSRLSALLHSFPREAAPLELAADIAQEIAKRQISPVTAGPVVASSQDATLTSSSVVTPAAASVMAPRSMRRELTAAAAASLLTAAALLMMAGPRWNTSGEMDGVGGGRVAQHQSTAPSWSVSSTEQRMMESSVRGRDAESGSPLPEVAKSLSTHGQSPAKSGDDSVLGDKSSARNQPALSASSMSKLPNTDLADAAVMAAETPGLVASNPITVNSLEQNQFLAATNLISNDTFTNALQAGQVVDLVPQMADPDFNVGVVEVAVVDIDRGAGEFQNLLNRHSIQPLSPVDSNGDNDDSESVIKQKEAQNFRRVRPKIANTDDSANAVGVTRNGELVCIYTVAKGEQLVKVLADVRDKTEVFSGWAPQPPIPLPTNNSYAQEFAATQGASKESVPSRSKVTGSMGAGGGGASAKDGGKRDIAVPKSPASTSPDSAVGDQSTVAVEMDEADYAVSMLMARNGMTMGTDLMEGEDVEALRRRSMLRQATNLDRQNSDVTSAGKPAVSQRASDTKSKVDGQDPAPKGTDKQPRELTEQARAESKFTARRDGTYQQIVRIPTEGNGIAVNPRYASRSQGNFANQNPTGFIAKNPVGNNFPGNVAQQGVFPVNSRGVTNTANRPDSQRSVRLLFFFSPTGVTAVPAPGAATSPAATPAPADGNRK